jgi:hypothetical protein
MPIAPPECVALVLCALIGTWVAQVNNGSLLAIDFVSDTTIDIATDTWGNTRTRPAPRRRPRYLVIAASSVGSDTPVVMLNTKRSFRGLRLQCLRTSGKEAPTNNRVNRHPSTEGDHSMFRKITLVLAATAALSTSALAPSSASAWGWYRYHSYHDGVAGHGYRISSAIVTRCRPTGGNIFCQ